MSTQQTSRLPLPVPAVRPRHPKAVGVRNRGANLAGRYGPDDVPIVKQESPTLAEEIAKANDDWRDVYQEETAQPSDFALRADEAYQDEKDSDHFDAHQFKIALTSEFGIEGGVSIGGLSGSPLRGIPRRSTAKTWWAFQLDKVRELIKSINASDTWPAGSQARVGYVIMYFFLERWEDKEIHEEIPEVFTSANAVKQFRKRLIEYASELFGADPDAEPISWREWREKTPDLNTKTPWSRVEIHNAVLGVGPSRRKGVR